MSSTFFTQTVTWCLSVASWDVCCSSLSVFLCDALGNVPLPTSTHVPEQYVMLCVQISLTTSDWDECSTWLTALKRLIKARQMLG